MIGFTIVTIIIIAYVCLAMDYDYRMNNEEN